MGNYKTIGQSGDHVYEIQGDGSGVKGVGVDALADATIAATSLDNTSGVVVVEDGTNNDTATFVVVNTAGTVAPQLIGTQAAFTGTKDNAATINLFYEAGVIQIQNNSGGAVDLVIKAYS